MQNDRIVYSSTGLEFLGKLVLFFAWLIPIPLVFTLTTMLLDSQKRMGIFASTTSVIEFVALCLFCLIPILIGLFLFRYKVYVSSSGLLIRHFFWYKFLSWEDTHYIYETSLLGFKLPFISKVIIISGSIVPEYILPIVMVEDANHLTMALVDSAKESNSAIEISPSLAGIVNELR